jgi:hypothetical protein
MTPIAQATSLEQVRDIIAKTPLSEWRAGAGRWSVAQILEHCAQSIEYSMAGYPQLRPWWFRRTLGPLAFAKFERDGRLSHDLSAPVPGAPPLGADGESARLRLVAAIDAFFAARGTLQEHLAFGRLEKARYATLHRLHLANHFETVEAG